MAGDVISDRFFTVISSILNTDVEGLTPDTSRDSLEAWDSIKHMYIVLALEEEFGIEVPDEQAEKLLTVGDVIKYIEEHQK